MHYNNLINCVILQIILKLIEVSGDGLSSNVLPTTLYLIKWRPVRVKVAALSITLIRVVEICIDDNIDLF